MTLPHTHPTGQQLEERKGSFCKLLVKFYIYDEILDGHQALHLYKVITVLQVDDNSHVQVLVSSGKRQRASCNAVAHPCIFCQGFTQVSSGFWMLATRTGKYSKSPLGGSSITLKGNLLEYNRMLL